MRGSVRPSAILKARGNRRFWMFLLLLTNSKGFSQTNTPRPSRVFSLCTNFSQNKPTVKWRERSQCFSGTPSDCLRFSSDFSSSRSLTTIPPSFTVSQTTSEMPGISCLLFSLGRTLDLLQETLPRCPMLYKAFPVNPATGPPHLPDQLQQSRFPPMLPLHLVKLPCWHLR